MRWDYDQPKGKLFVSDGKYLWPGFGENVRVLKWIAERVRGEADAEQTVIGHVPTTASLDLAGLDLPALGYACTDRVSTSAATHLIVTKHLPAISA